MREHLRHNPCVDCHETDITVLEFDHVRGVKNGNVGRIARDRSFDDLKKEIKKCQVRCANCHRRKTLKERGISWYMESAT